MKKNENTAQQYRTAQLWSVLVFAARHQEIVSYLMIERLTGIPRQGVSPYLNLIHEYCEDKQWPSLAVLAVNEATGKPGSKYWAKIDVLAAQSRVFAFDWLKDKAPSPQDFINSN